MFKVIRRAIARWSQLQELNHSLDDTDDLLFLTLGQGSPGATLQRRVSVTDDCTVRKFLLRVQSNARTVTTVFTSFLDAGATTQIITILTLAIGIASSAETFRALEGQELSAQIEMNPPDVGNAIVIRGIGWGFSQ